MNEWMNELRDRTSRTESRVRQLSLSAELFKSPINTFFKSPVLIKKKAFWPADGTMKFNTGQKKKKKQAGEGRVPLPMGDVRGDSYVMTTRRCSLGHVRGEDHVFLALTKSTWMFLRFISRDIWHQEQGVQKVAHRQSLHMSPCWRSAGTSTWQSSPGKEDNAKAKPRLITNSQKAATNVSEGQVLFSLWCRSAAAWRPSWRGWWEGCRRTCPAGGDRDTLRISWWSHRRSRGSTKRQSSLQGQNKTHRKQVVNEKPTVELSSCWYRE